MPPDIKLLEPLFIGDVLWPRRQIIFQGAGSNSPSFTLSIPKSLNCINQSIPQCPFNLATANTKSFTGSANRLHKVSIDTKLPPKSPPKPLQPNSISPTEDSSHCCPPRSYKLRPTLKKTTKQISIPALGGFTVPSYPYPLSSCAFAAFSVFHSCHCPPLCPCCPRALSQLLLCKHSVQQDGCAALDIPCPFPSPLVPELLRLHHFPGITASQCSGRTGAIQTNLFAGLFLLGSSLGETTHFVSHHSSRRQCPEFQINMTF